MPEFPRIALDSQVVSTFARKLAGRLETKGWSPEDMTTERVAAFVPFQQDLAAFAYEHTRQKGLPPFLLYEQALEQIRGAQSPITEPAEELELQHS